MGIDHGRPYIGIAEQLLDRTDVIVCLQKMGGEGVAERVRGHALGELSLPDGKIHRILKARVMYVVPPLLPV